MNILKERGLRVGYAFGASLLSIFVIEWFRRLLSEDVSSTGLVLPYAYFGLPEFIYFLFVGLLAAAFRVDKAGIIFWYVFLFVLVQVAVRLVFGEFAAQGAIGYFILTAPLVATAVGFLAGSLVSLLIWRQFIRPSTKS